MLPKAFWWRNDCEQYAYQLFIFLLLALTIHRSSYFGSSQFGAKKKKRSLLSCRLFWINASTTTWIEPNTFMTHQHFLVYYRHRKDGKFEMSDGEWFFWVHLLWSKRLNANWWWIHAGNVITLWHCEMKIKTFKSKCSRSTVAPMGEHEWNRVPGSRLLLLVLFRGCRRCPSGTGRSDICCNMLDMLSPPVCSAFQRKLLFSNPRNCIIVACCNSKSHSSF